MTACSSGDPASTPDAGTFDAGEADAGEEPDAGEVSDDVDAARYCEEIEPFFCSFYLRCNRIAATDEEGCRALFRETCPERYLPRYLGLAQAGMLKLSRAGLATCRAHLDTVACEKQVFDVDGPCRGMWVGTQPAGSACGLDIESFVCAPGSRCVLGLNLCGTCEPTARVGEACGEGTSCEDTARCIDGHCAARARFGETCDETLGCLLGLSCTNGICTAPGRASEGEACGANIRCPYATVCTQGACRKQALMGEACSGSPGCASGWCSNPQGGTCEHLKPAGAACNYAIECATGPCREHVCEPSPSACIAQ